MQNDLVFKIGTLITFDRTGAWRVIAHIRGRTMGYRLRAELRDSKDATGNLYKYGAEIQMEETLAIRAVILAAGKI